MRSRALTAFRRAARRKRARKLAPGCAGSSRARSHAAAGLPGEAPREQRPEDARRAREQRGTRAVARGSRRPGRSDRRGRPALQRLGAAPRHELVVQVDLHRAHGAAAPAQGRGERQPLRFRASAASAGASTEPIGPGSAQPYAWPPARRYTGQVFRHAPQRMQASAERWRGSASRRVRPLSTSTMWSSAPGRGPVTQARVRRDRLAGRAAREQAQEHRRGRRASARSFSMPRQATWTRRQAHAEVGVAFVGDDHERAALGDREVRAGDRRVGGEEARAQVRARDLGEPAGVRLARGRASSRANSSPMSSRDWWIAGMMMCDGGSSASCTIRSPRSVSITSMPLRSEVRVEPALLGEHRLALHHPARARAGQDRRARPRAARPASSAQWTRAPALCAASFEALEVLVQVIERVGLDPARLLAQPLEVGLRARPRLIALHAQREYRRVVRGEPLALGQQLRRAAVECRAHAPSRAARISARWIGSAGPLHARGAARRGGGGSSRRCRSRTRRRSRRAPRASRRPIRADSSGYSTENAPPKPQHSSRRGSAQSSSPATASAGARSRPCPGHARCARSASRARARAARDSSRAAPPCAGSARRRRSRSAPSRGTRRARRCAPASARASASPTSSAVAVPNRGHAARRGHTTASAPLEDLQVPAREPAPPRAARRWSRTAGRSRSAAGRTKTRQPSRSSSSALGQAHARGQLVDVARE